MTDLFESFELDDEYLGERPETECFHRVLLILTTVRTKPRVVGTKLQHQSLCALSCTSTGSLGTVHCQFVNIHHTAERVSGYSRDGS